MQHFLGKHQTNEVRVRFDNHVHANTLILWFHVLIYEMDFVRIRI